jgi:hypothetical protein
MQDTAGTEQVQRAGDWTPASAGLTVITNEQPPERVGGHPVLRVIKGGRA